jgi:hypothetical protein
MIMATKLLGVLCLLAVLHANAAVITYNFAGTLTQLTNVNTGLTVDAGAPFSGRFSYDTDGAAIYSEPGYTAYSGATFMEFTIGALTITGGQAAGSSMNVYNDYPLGPDSGYLDNFSARYVPDIPAVFPEMLPRRTRMDVAFSTDAPNPPVALGSLAIPDALDLSSFTFALATVEFLGSELTTGSRVQLVLRGPITSLTLQEVPEPSTITVGLGLLALALIRRSRG